MIDLLRRWFFRNRVGIFAFFDGTRSRRADPMAVSRALFSHSTFDWEHHPPLIDVPDPKVSLDALGVTADAVRTAFGIPSVDAGGLTEIECVDLLAAFVSYLNGLKKSTGNSPSLPGHTATVASDRSTTKHDAASCSTPTASSTGEPSAS